ncbi:MAG: proprotein convertase P-domain-containing protein, partial [Planctomycetota bacterium]
NVGEDAVVTVGDTIYIPHHQQGIEAGMTISGNASVTCDDLQVVNDGGNTGWLHISGNPTITMNEFLMNNDAGDPGTSEVIMDGGTVTVSGDSTINDDGPGTATFTLNGGTFNAGDDLDVSDNLDGTGHLTVNGGKMIVADEIRLGSSGGDDIGQSRVFLNGGLLQAWELRINITDSQIIITGGALKIGSADVSEEEMQQLIDDGTIVVDMDEYILATDGAYTLLGATPVAAWNASPADGTTGMSITPVIDTYVSGDVPKNIPDSYGNSPRGVTSTLDVPDSVQITDLNVELDIRKPGNNADLNAYLTSPDGKRVELFTDVGFEGDDFTNTILDDEAGTSIRNGSSPFTGLFRPEGRLSDFDGRRSDGTWQLRIEDDWPGGPGRLNSWQLVMESPIVLSWNPGVGAVSQNVYLSDNFSDVSERAGGALLASVAGDDSSTPGKALEWDTTYYWCVDAVDVNDNVASGDIWSFATAISNAGAEVRIANGDDDVEEKLDSGDLDVGSSDYEMPYEDWDPLADPQRVGMRFVNVGVPAGSQITESYIEFVVDASAPRDTGVESVSLIIDAQLTGDAEAFVDEPYNVSNRSFTEAIPWSSIEPWPTGGEKKRTPDLSVLVEELINQEDWASGNAMVYTIQDDPCNPSEGIRAVESANGAGGAAPLLVIVGVTDAATRPSPADGAVDVPQDAKVSWDPGNSTVARIVYFGTENPPPRVSDITTGITHDPGELAVSTTYYLKVDEYEADGTKHEGAVWSFTTIIGEATNPDPADGATDV